MQSSSLSVRLYKRLKEKKILFVYFPLVVYWLLIFVLTTIPTDIVPQVFKAQDKVEHLLAYFVLAFFLSLTISLQTKNVNLSKHLIIVTLCLIMLYGAIDELHQIFIPGRVADITDWLADSLGGLLGILAVSFFIKKGSAG